MRHDRYKFKYVISSYGGVKNSWALWVSNDAGVDRQPIWLRQLVFQDSGQLPGVAEG